jgi:hypothetical protein
MYTNLIPFRTHHFLVPAPSVMKVLRIALANDLRFYIRNVSNNEQFLSLTLSVNLTIVSQRNAVTEIEALLVTAPENNNIK